MTPTNTLRALLVSEEGSSPAELALFLSFVVLAVSGFFCFTAGQFRDVYETSYAIR